MEDKDRTSGKEYYKVVLVRVQADEYVILKGPKEEKCLAKVLQNDYNSTKYEKMLRLLAEEVVQKEYRERFYATFSMENILKEFREGNSLIEFSYMRNLGRQKRMVTTRVYPRMMQGGAMEEFMVYVVCHEEGSKCGRENAEENEEL